MSLECLDEAPDLDVVALHRRRIHAQTKQTDSPLHMNLPVAAKPLEQTLSALNDGPVRDQKRGIADTAGTTEPGRKKRLYHAIADEPIDRDGMNVFTPWLL